MINHTNIPHHHFFSAAPHLQALTIEDIPAPIVPRFVFVKNLTKLHMRAICIDHVPEEYLKLLAQCSNLTHCAIHCCLMHSLGKNYPLGCPRTLPKLKHLQSEGYCLHFSCVGVLLNMLTLPQVEFISVEFWLDKTAYSTSLVPNPADHPRDEFRTLIGRSAYTLSLDPWPVDPYFFEMVASVSPARTIWTCDGDLYHRSHPDYFHQHWCAGPLLGLASHHQLCWCSPLLKQMPWPLPLSSPPVPKSLPSSAMVMCMFSNSMILVQNHDIKRGRWFVNERKQCSNLMKAHCRFNIWTPSPIVFRQNFQSPRQKHDFSLGPVPIFIPVIISSICAQFGIIFTDQHAVTSGTSLQSTILL